MVGGGDERAAARPRGELLDVQSVDLLPRPLKPWLAAVTNAPQRAHAVNYWTSSPSTFCRAP
jgi:hypothetical protein